ncbi:hypothetical protein H2202_004870 [Exophiala xenobiotica]|nr:hypothetical protein H2202_004870 [Exophiala xenobiotica]
MATATLVDEYNVLSTNGQGKLDRISKPLKSSKSPLPEVAELDSSSATADDVVKCLKVAGGVIVRNLLGSDEINRILEDVIPYLDEDQPWDGEFFPPETRRAFGLMGKSRTFATSIVGNPLWIGVADALLTSHSKYNWVRYISFSTICAYTLLIEAVQVGDKNEESISVPQVHNTIAFRIGPGASAQPLHRDDGPHHPDHRAIAEHVLGRDSGVGLFVAGTKATKANGSHLWDYREGPPKEEQTFQAELNPGDAFMMLSGCFHGGSANTTEDEDRILLSTFSTRGWLRQEENQYLANSIESIKDLPPALQERMGYGLSRPFMGWVELKSPMLLLHPQSIKDLKDLWGS